MKRTIKGGKSKLILGLLTALLFNCIVGAFGASILGFSPLAGMAAANGIATLPGIFRLAGFTAMQPMHGVFYAGVVKEVYTDIIMEQFIMEGTFLSRSQDMSAFVDNGVINLADAGVEPDVLKNNNTYPIPMSQRTDSGLALPLDYYSTKSTFITSLEEAQTVYDKTASVTRGHKRALQRNAFARAAHAWTPASDTTYTPVLATTGADRGNGFKALTLKDIATLQEKFDSLEIPTEGRVLVLHPTHRADLLNQDASLFKKFAELEKGQVLPLYGFDTYVYANTAIFNQKTGAKVAYGAAAAPSTDTVSSFAYCESEVMHCLGTLEMFYRLNDPDVQGDIFNFAQQYMALPIRSKAIAGIYAAIA